MNSWYLQTICHEFQQIKRCGYLTAYEQTPLQYRRIPKKMDGLKLVSFMPENEKSEDFSEEEVMKENIAKLRQRYPKQFTSELAAARLDKI